MKIKVIRFSSVLLLATSIFSCGKGQQSTDIAVGDKVSLLEGVELDYNHAFFDDFAQGVSKDNWYIGKQAWGTSNGGVIPENVKYTDDGVLVLTGNGNYYTDGDVRGVGDVKDGRYTGAALISKFTVHAGRYEIKMKVLPRQGACTAFWTYANDVETASNHEIDIELPGGNRTGEYSFERILNTNYITEQMNQSQDTRISDILEDDTEVFLNDGEWHTFGFDWYTEPEKVVYYVDGHVTAISTVFIPNMESRLWIGCWFPVSSNLVGQAEFETDNMYVDYVKYIPFKNQVVTKFTPPISGYAFDSEYPTKPIATPTINKVANGNFEKIATTIKNNSFGAWKLNRRASAQQPLEELINIAVNEGYDQSNALCVREPGLAQQTIDSVFHNFQYDLSFFAKGNGKLTVRYYEFSGNIISSIPITINSENLTQFTASLVAPSNSYSMRLVLESDAGSSVVIDNVEIYQK